MFTPDAISTLYVSKEIGNDERNFGFYAENTYMAEGPVATIERALSFVEELRDSGHDQPVTIVLMDEVYEFKKPLVLTPKMHSITIKSHKKALFSGGFEIKNFKKDVFNGVECFSAYVPEVESGIWFTDLYVDGERARFTKYPKEGTLEPEYVENNNTDLGESSSWFVAKKEHLADIAKFKNFGDCFISYNHYWVDEHTPVKSYDLESGKIEFEYPSRFSLSSKHPRSALHYIVENVAECFENPNEWYLDRETSKVYYIPRDNSQTVETIKVVAPLTDKLIVLKGEKNKKLRSVHFENIEFAYTKGDYRSVSVTKDGKEKYYASDSQSVNAAHASVEFYHTENCSIENCILHSLGVHAISINEGTSNTRICKNHIYDIGAGGIKAGGCNYVKDENGESTIDLLDINSKNIIKNNRIEKCGRRYYAGCGILIKHSRENYIAHNEISDIFYSGISIGWVWGYTDSVGRDNIIEKNLIYNIGSGVLSDMGGIYTLGKMPGTIIRNNIIHDVTCFDYGAWGIYLDEGTSYVTVENNLCYNLGKNAFHQHYGRMNTVRNNIFVKSGNEVASVSGSMINNTCIFERNIMVADGNPIYHSMYASPTHESAPNSIIAHNNLVFDTKGEVVAMGDNTKISLKEFKTVYGNDKYTLEADPMFLDYEKNDFRLKPGSPAYKMGFEEIDLSDVGIIGR